MILVDTSVLIDFFRGIKNRHVDCLHNVIKQEIPFGITSVIYQEILQGARTAKESQLLTNYLGGQYFIFPQDPILSYQNAAMIYFSCRKKGITPRSTIDCLIAQVCIEHDALLLHNDQDFELMAGVIPLKIYSV